MAERRHRVRKRGAIVVAQLALGASFRRAEQRLENRGDLLGRDRADREVDARVPAELVGCDLLEVDRVARVAEVRRPE